MTKTQKELLSRLMSVCGDLGGILDGTATCTNKYIDRQQAHGLTRRVIFGVFGDNVNNPYRKEDISDAFESIEKMEKLVQKIYPDKAGFLKYEEKTPEQLTNETKNH